MYEALPLYPPNYLWLWSPCGPWPVFHFLNPYTVGRTPWTGDQPVARALPTHRTTQTRNKRTQTSIPRVGFEPTIPVFERAKTVRALERSATVISLRNKLHALNVRKLKSVLPFLLSRPTEPCPLTQIVITAFQFKLELRNPSQGSIWREGTISVDPNILC
jgi:hypothetical protein